MSEALTDAFRQAMRKAAASVYVVAAGTGEERVGMTATAVTSLSFDPLSMLVCVNASSSCHPVLSKGGRFSLSLLSPRDEDVAIAFSTPGNESKRFTIGDWQQGNGVPVLTTAAANITLEITQMHEAGTHTVFFADVLTVTLNDGSDALLYADGGFGGFKRPS